MTPSHHEDRTALQESRENIEHHLEHMNQETRDSSSTRLWRRISMINVSSYRKMDNQLDVLGNTTWGIRNVTTMCLIQSIYSNYSATSVLYKTQMLIYTFADGSGCASMDKRK